MKTPIVVAIVFSCVFCAAVRAQDAKPKAAVFPLAGTATEEQREKVGFALRKKLERDGHFEPIDGPTMTELAAGADKPPGLDTTPEKLMELGKAEGPVVLIWGELDTAGAGFSLKVKTLDTRDKSAKPVETDKTISTPNDLRFVTEQVLQSIGGVGAFSHPVEDAVIKDPKSIELWKTNPNLLPDGDFAAPGKWTGILRSEKYPAPLVEHLPDTDKVVIYKLPVSKKAVGDNMKTQTAEHNVLAMKLSEDVATSNGLACLSAPFDIEPAARYRIQFKYKSDGPSLHVFVKGYIHGKDIVGEVNDLQDYECQVPPSGPTHGKWETVVCDINPQNPSGSPKFLKVDLYAYLGAGTVMFDDVQVKAVGTQTRHAIDDAIKPPASQPVPR